MEWHVPGVDVTVFLESPSRGEGFAALVTNRSLLFRHHVVRVVLLPVLHHRLLRGVGQFTAREVTRILYLVLRVLLVDVQLQAVVLGKRFATRLAESRFETLVLSHVTLEPHLTAELFAAQCARESRFLATVQRLVLRFPLLLLPPSTSDGSLIFRLTLASFRTGICLGRTTIIRVFLHFHDQRIIINSVVIGEIKLFNLQGINVWFAFQ